MKFFALFVVLFALAASAMSLKNDVCGQPDSADGHPNGIRCMALLQVWTYKQSINECELFYYGGCGGNDNRFYSKEACEDMCKE